MYFEWQKTIKLNINLFKTKNIYTQIDTYNELLLPKKNYISKIKQQIIKYIFKKLRFFK